MTMGRAELRVMADVHVTDRLSDEVGQSDTANKTRSPAYLGTSGGVRGVRVWGLDWVVLSVGIFFGLAWM